MQYISTMITFVMRVSTSWSVTSTFNTLPMCMYILSHCSQLHNVEWQFRDDQLTIASAVFARCSASSRLFLWTANWSVKVFTLTFFFSSWLLSIPSSVWSLELCDSLDECSILAACSSEICCFCLAKTASLLALDCLSKSISFCKLIAVNILYLM